METEPAVHERHTDTYYWCTLKCKYYKKQKQTKYVTEKKTSKCVGTLSRMKIGKLFMYFKYSNEEEKNNNSHDMVTVKETNKNQI